MPSISLPFIITGLLSFLLIRMAQRRVWMKWFMLFLGICAIQSLLVGLRWSLDPDWIRWVQPVVAACIPPLGWAAFEALRDVKVSPLHGLWPIAAALFWWLLPSALDLLLFFDFVLYALLILRLRFPEEILAQVRIGDEWAVSHARYVIAALLLFSALVDAVVAFDLIWGDGTITAPTIATMMSVFAVGLAGAFLVRTSHAVPDTSVEEPIPEPIQTPVNTDEEQAILAKVEAVLAQGLYRDYDLTLQRLSRRTGVPTRKISQSVNRLQDRTITDLINSYRVNEAMRLLRDSSLPITQIMLEAGFQTKSNFNRAFKEITGQTPSDFRRSESG